METFGRYQLQEKLGQGGMGVVYRAFDTVLERVVALKLVLTPQELDPEMRQRFFREARAAGHLSHKNVVTIYDLGEHEDKPYLAMEYLDGEDLQKRLARPERMSLMRRLSLAIEICEGVEYAHAHGVIHRDLKPANIYITESGSAKILDFGLARVMTSQLTRSNMLMGTLNYMAPEQVRGERADQRSDVFSVGVVLYELLSGRRAFEGDSVASTLYKILQEVPEPLERIDAALPRDLVAIVERALAKLRDERYPDMGALRRDLEAFRQQHQATGPATPTPRPAPVSAPGPAGWERIAPPAEPPVAPASAAAEPGSGAGAHPAYDSRTRTSGRRLALGAGAILVLAAGAWFALNRPQRSETAPTPAATVERGEAPLTGRLRGAQQALDARQYGAALGGAEAVLLLMPQNADAQRIRAAARDGAVAEALDRGSRHLKNGNTSDAIKAAGEVLSLAPDNADARRVLDQAGARTSGPDAESARRRMIEGREAAVAAGAPTLAASSLNKASSVARDADRLHNAKRFADAASRYYESSGLYRAAEVAARNSAPPPNTTASRPAPPPQPMIEQATPVPQAPTPPPAPPPTPTPTPTPTLPVAAPASTPVPASPPPAAPAPAPETAPAPTAEERISELIGRYRDALESKNIEQLKRLWPSLSGAAESAIRQEFQHATRIMVDIAEPQVSVSGGSGRVTFTRRYTVVTVEGQRHLSTTPAVMNVKRAGTSWVIDAIRFSTR